MSPKTAHIGCFCSIALGFSVWIADKICGAISIALWGMGKCESRNYGRAYANEI